jgi:uncharacterized protein (DUF427 family)
MSLLMSDAMARLMDELRHEPIMKRIRARSGDRVVVDTTDAMLVYEPRRVSPMYAVPEPAIRAGLVPGGPVTPGRPGFLHPGIPFTVHSAPGESLSVDVDGRIHEDAAFRPADPDLAGYVLLDFDAFDWLEEDEPVHAHPRSPYHRIDVRQSSRHLQIADRGRPLVDTTRPVLLFETGLPVRFYVPREDVVAELRPGRTRSYCPYKGAATYFSTGDRDDVAWSYQDPLLDATQIAGLVAFWDDVLEVTLDGVPQGRAETEGAKALREEFDVGAA